MFRRLRLLVLTAFATGLMTSEVSAQQQEFGPYHRPPPGDDDGSSGSGRNTELAAGDYVHDGFYLRLAGGLGFASDKLRGEGRTSRGSAGPLEGSVSGFAGGTQVALGFTPVRGWVFGGSVDTVTFTGGSGSLDRDLASFEFKTSQLAVYGVLLDVYPDPLRGFHVQATGGIASFVMAQGNSAGGAGVANVIAAPHAAVGGGFSLGVGNQWWLDPDWTIGVLGRFMIGWANGNDQYGKVFKHRATGYTVLLTTTYH